MDKTTMIRMRRNAKGDFGWLIIGVMLKRCSGI